MIQAGREAPSTVCKSEQYNLHMAVYHDRNQENNCTAAIFHAFRGCIFLWIMVIYHLSLGQTSSYGGIAQLGERLNGIQEVSGSIPLISTRTSPVLLL